MIVVVGAGAAGLVAAAFASSPDRPAVLIERTPDGGRKILISGGGRCNVLPAALEPERFVTASPPHLLRRMLRAWPLEHQKKFFEEELGIPLKFEADSRKYFPASDRAHDVRDALVAFARRRGVEIRFNTRVDRIERRADGLERMDDGRWRVITSAGNIDANAVVLATGGLSVPATGSDGAGLGVAKSLGHAVHDLYPALAPLVADPPVHAGLAGVSLDVRVRVRNGGKTRESHGGFLFTHRGYSGPSVLDVSHFAVAKGAEIRVAWSELTPAEWIKRLTSGTGSVASIVAGVIPQRLADFLIREAKIPEGRRVPSLTRTERTTLVELLTAYPLKVSGDEGYKKAEVTGGGVALDDVDVTTLESKRAPGLFLCGEMLDAYGPIGGHNFAWAWSTGRAAGLGARIRS